MSLDLKKDAGVKKELRKISILTELHEADNSRVTIKLQVPFNLLPKIRETTGAEYITDEKVRKYLRDFAISKIDERYNNVPYSFAIQIPFVGNFIGDKPLYLEIGCFIRWKPSKDKVYPARSLETKLSRIPEGLIAIEKLIKISPALCQFLKPHCVTLKKLKEFQETSNVKFLLKALEKDLSPLLLGCIEKGKKTGHPLPHVVWSATSRKNFVYPNQSLYVGNNVLAEARKDPIIEFLNKQIREWELNKDDPKCTQKVRDKARKVLSEINEIFESRHQMTKPRKRIGRKIKHDLIDDITGIRPYPELLVVIRDNIIEELNNYLAPFHTGPKKWDNKRADISKFASKYGLTVNHKYLREWNIRDNPSIALVLMGSELKCPFDTLRIAFRKFPKITH